jgi:hypothetical protein
VFGLVGVVSLIFSSIAYGSSYSVLVGGDIKSTNSFITYGAGANLHTNGNLKNNGLFNVSGDVEIVGSLFTASGTHPLVATGSIILPAQYITIPVLSPQCWPTVNYRFEGGTSNNSGYIQIYDDSGNLSQTITGGKWDDPSGNHWEYNANLNRWHVSGNNPEVLNGIIYFGTAFKTDVPELDIGNQTNGGMLVVNGAFQSESSLHIQALFSYEHAAVVFGDATLHGGEDEESEAEEHKGWIDDSAERNVGYNNLIKGRVYITGNLESTSPTKIDGKLTILGNLDTEGAMRVEYMDGATTVASAIIAQHFSTPVTLAASENFSDPTGSGSTNMYLFEKGNVSITPTTNILDLIESISSFTGNTIMVLGGADETSPPVSTIYNNFPNTAIQGLVQIINALENNYHVNLNDIAVTNFIHTYPNDLWVTISLTGTTMGTFLLSKGSQFYSMTTDGLNQYLQQIDWFKTNYPQQWQQYLQAARELWSYYLQTGTTNPAPSLGTQSFGTLSILNETTAPPVCNEDPVIPDDNWCTLTPVVRHDVPGYFDPHFPNNNLTTNEIATADLLFDPFETTIYQIGNQTNGSIYNPTSDSLAEYQILFGFNYQQYNQPIYPAYPTTGYGYNICGPSAATVALGYWGLNGSSGYQCVYTHDLASGTVPPDFNRPAYDFFASTPPAAHPINGYPGSYWPYSNQWSYSNPSYWPYLMLEGDLVNLMHPNVWSFPWGGGVNEPGTSPWDFVGGVDSYKMRDYTGKYYGGCFASGWQIINTPATPNNIGSSSPDDVSVWDNVKHEIDNGNPVIVLFPLAYNYQAHYVTVFGYHKEHYTNVCKTYWTWCWINTKCSVTVCYPCFNADSFWITYSDNQGDTDVESAIMYATPVTGYANTTYLYTIPGMYWTPIDIWIHPSGTCNQCRAIPPLQVGSNSGSGGWTCNTSDSSTCPYDFLIYVFLAGLFVLWRKIYEQQ